MNGGCFGAEIHRIECETASPVLVLGYVVNGGWFGAETDRIKCEIASPVLVSGYEVNGGWFGAETVVSLHCSDCLVHLLSHA